MPHDQLRDPLLVRVLVDLLVEETDQFVEVVQDLLAALLVVEAKHQGPAEEVLGVEGGDADGHTPSWGCGPRGRRAGDRHLEFVESG